MKRLLSLYLLCLCTSVAVWADFETAFEAVCNMKIGWNLGNTLDSNSGDTLNMWNEWNANPTPASYETMWGQPMATRELITMFRKAGFNAIRVPVTWYPHMGIKCETVLVDGSYKRIWRRSEWTENKVDAAWMKRVHAVVDYVMSQGMYCIINVHHDTGASNTAWLRADEKAYEAEKERFAALWKQIAEEFKGYSDHLLFEGYNEMLDPLDSWCFASYAASGNYDASVAASAYKAINGFAQTFVDAVRSTGSNNSKRNLIVSTYAASSGSGNWNSHLLDPLKQLNVPKDEAASHIIMEVHSYPSVKNLTSAKNEVRMMFSDLDTYIVKQKGVPVIVGEWGSGESDAYTTYRDNKIAFCRYFVEQAKAKNIPTFYWMGLSDGEYRTKLQFNEPELVDAIVKGYYGNMGYDGIVMGDANDDGFVNVADITTIASYILGKKPQRFVFDNADIDEDGLISISDITATARIILK